MKPTPTRRKSPRQSPPRRPTTRHPLTLHITTAVSAPSAILPFLRRNLRSAHKLLKSPITELSIALVGDSHMSDLHQRYLNIPGPTDVLTFELAHDKRHRPTSGEVVVCLPYARRSVALNRLPLRVEVLLYCLHGMLHLSGHDDRRPRDYKLMHAAEDDILTRLGLPAAFAAGNRVSS